MKYISDLIMNYPGLKNNSAEIQYAYEALAECYECYGKLLVAGNGGSAADAEHIVGELMKGFLLPRGVKTELVSKLKDMGSKGRELSGKLQLALPAIALNVHNSLNTAIINDIGGNMCFAQQVLGYGKCGDIFWGISTSGNSKNIVYAAITAKAMGLKVIGLTGKGGGELAALSDVLIAVPETETYKIQEMHLPIYHCICRMLEERFFGGEKV